MATKRPSDEEVAAVAEVLKEWGMEKGYQTAAVLALVAAAKTRERPKREKCTDEEMLKFLDGIIGTVEATRAEQSHLWQLYTKELKQTWKESSFGLGECVGFIDDRPVWISLNTATVKGHKTLFWHPTSPVVDHDLIDEWLKLNTPNNRTDATNFHNIFPRD